MNWPHNLPEKPADGPVMPVADAPHSVFEELARVTAQRDAAWIEVAQLRVEIARLNGAKA